MLTDGENNKWINKDNSDFPEYLDFDKLRAEGIAYLGKLSGKIWTDHNVHDPGITILEVLCYSLLDLGYRTNLPSIDLFARNPLDTSKDDNFFSPAQILTCNPLTIMDYRKLLIDIEGVKNAWLEIATDQFDFCNSENNQFLHSTQNGLCVDYLNGLYHVIIEPEKDINKDFDSETEQTNHLEEIKNRIKAKLMTNRNFCQDFVDFNFLCKMDVGICASIEISIDADIDKIYPEIIQKLRDFISPSPKFYTLQELLDKGKSIEDIYAGRPYDLIESHGFIDSEELEELKLKKEIHLSDLYQIILEIEGVKSVNSLSLNNCETNWFQKIDLWKYKIPENNVPNFSIKCTDIQFKRNGIPLEFDKSKFENVFKLSFTYSGKVIYQQGSPYLDYPIPNGNYYENLDDYYLLQEDFPKVYGISEGGLADDVSNHRKAQALQLKGYLLFFDQILAGYLSQLKNLRKIFAMNSSDNAEDRRTYFINKLADEKDLGTLLRFAVGTDQSTQLGTEGDALVRVVPKADLIQLIHADKPKISSLNPYKFSSLSKQKIEIHQLIEDFSSNNYEVGFIEISNGKIYYYILGSSDEFGLISKISFNSIAEANLHLNSVSYVGSFEENYRSFIIDENQVSFELELNISTFKSYLALIVEDNDLYHARRNTFLNHLLARFAERFTDNVLYQYKNNADVLIQAKENLLFHYDEISANRSKAYDYLANNWQSDNISGFEIEAKYLAGIENKGLNSLCNFVVEQIDNYYLVDLSIGNETYFSLKERFDSQKEAEEAAQLVFNSLANPEKLQTKYIPHEKKYEVVLHYNAKNSVSFFKQYDTSQEADEVRIGLSRSFANKPNEEVYISSYGYKTQLLDHDDQVIRSSVSNHDSETAALDFGFKTISKLNDAAQWVLSDITDKKILQLSKISSENEIPKFLDTKDYKINIHNNIVGKPDKFSYDLLDHNNSFKFYPTKEFKSNKEAKSHALQVLLLAVDQSNYSVGRTSIDSKYQLNIVKDNQVEATSYAEFETEKEALELQELILDILNKSSYKLGALAMPKGWKFNFELGFEPDANFQFSSTKEYLYKEDALKAAQVFQQALPSLKVGKSKNTIMLSQQNKASKLPTVSLSPESTSSEDNLTKALSVQKHIAQYNSTEKPQIFSSSIRQEYNENSPRFVYRLVDKDNVIAYNQIQFFSKEEAIIGRMKSLKWLKRGLKYLQLCLGGPAIQKINVNGSKSVRFKYQIRAHNLTYKNVGPIGEEIILFESVLAFENEEKALEAFEINFFDILEKASLINNYGSFISYDEINNQNSSALVFIPKVTQEELNSYQEGTVAEVLVKWIMSYPIKRSDDKYYFETYLNDNQEQGWHSLKMYETAVEAWQDFDFFLMLIKYHGNLFIDCNHLANEAGEYRIYIREVLAESSNRFYSEEEAWGEPGVQNFICAVQSEIGFHKYQKQTDCCYSFYLNCAEDFLIHPCTYDTAKKRNQIQLDLFDKFKQYVELESYSFSSEQGYLIFKDEFGKPFAKKIMNRNNEDFCGQLFQILEEIQPQDNFYSIEEQYIYLRDKDGEIILQSYNPEGDIESFKHKLTLFLCYFPISRKLNPSNNSYQYSIEIKLPGFNSCEEDNQPNCGCNSVELIESNCFVAWKTVCSLNSCKDALLRLLMAYELLKDYENYQSILDCSCNSFGIALRLRFPQLREELRINGLSLAYNPQCYPTAEVLCKAVERTIQLTNAEGLHAVEHILLRPRCPEDCDDEQYYLYEGRLPNLRYKWILDHSDPCSTSEDICFLPGQDPYSFIATVILPAWVKRFRSETGRLIMEDILYRLAPAHVMLRILWLAPHDLCCFESKYKDWRRWIAKKNTCNPYFIVNDLKNFLFQRNFEQLKGCVKCKPCIQKEIFVNPCLSSRLIQDLRHQDDFLNQVNRTYNWMVSYPQEYEFRSCDDSDNQVYYAKKEGIKKDVVVKKLAENVQVEPIPAQKFVKKGNPREFKLLKDKRLQNYRHNIDQFSEKLSKNKVIQSVQNYMADPTIAFTHLEPLVTQIIENKKLTSKDYKVLNKPQRDRVMETVISYSLDQLNYKTKNITEMAILESVFEKIRKAKIDVSRIFNHWDGIELKKFQPKVNVQAIKKIMLGK